MIINFKKCEWDIFYTLDQIYLNYSLPISQPVKFCAHAVYDSVWPLSCVVLL